jgi:hypothetical protein
MQAVQELTHFAESAKAVMPDPVIALSQQDARAIAEVITLIGIVGGERGAPALDPTDLDATSSSRDCENRLHGRIGGEITSARYSDTTPLAPADRPAGERKLAATAGVAHNPRREYTQHTAAIERDSEGRLPSTWTRDDPHRDVH